MTSERKVVVITGASRGVNTIPGMPCIHHDQYDIDGIRVERFTTAPKDAAQRPPLICVHGGCHASWSWQEHAPVYAAAGYEVHALNWRGRGGSAAINDDLFVSMSDRRRRRRYREGCSLLRYATSPHRPFHGRSRCTALRVGARGRRNLYC